MTEGHDHGHAHDHDERRGGVRGWIRSIMGGHHHHDAGDSIDAALRSSREGLRALAISLAGLGLTAALQVVIVLVSGSVALLADTVHNAADALTAIPLAVAFWIGRRPATRRYTYGYGRAEDLAGLFVVAMIALSAAVAAWESVHRLLDPQPVRNLGWVMAAGIIGFAGNELVAVYRIRVGRRIGSAALVADGLHARTDGLTSLGVLAGAIGVAAGFPLADPIVGLVITVAILAVLRSATGEIYGRLMDRVDPDLVERVERVLLGVPGLLAVDSVRVRWIGHELRVEADAVSDSGASLVQAHDAATEAHHRLLHEIPRLTDATIHVSPSGDGERDHHARLAHHRQPGPASPGLSAGPSQDPR
jgi:cation diffusion facilitator family transporter